MLVLFLRLTFSVESIMQSEAFNVSRKLGC
jgi:hypothetical protein